MMTEYQKELLQMLETMTFAEWLKELASHIIDDIHDGNLDETEVASHIVAIWNEND